jgi:coenzyme F420-reducing hydrogenase delta subunit/Fe-S-cluster-containing hydrogenase component 2
MCTGRVDMAFLLRAFQKGADGVIVGGCWLGECHYVTEGNYYALNMMHLAKRLVQHAGLSPDRLRIEWISASEGVRFAEVMNDFTDQLKKLGPRGEAEGMEEETLQARLEEIGALLPYIKIEKKEKLALRLDSEDEYDQLYTTDEIRELIENAVSYWVDPEKCQACMICARKCPVHGIEGAKGLIHVIDQALCIKCGTCYDACPERFDAISVLTGNEPVPPPIPEEKRVIERKDKRAG